MIRILKIIENLRIFFYVVKMIKKKILIIII